MTGSNNVPAPTKTAVVITSGILVLGAGVGLATTASADTPAPYPTAAPTSFPAPGAPLPSSPGAPLPSSPGAPPPSSPPPGAERPDVPTTPEQQLKEAALIQVLSAMLGVDEAQIKAALDEIRAAYVAQGPAGLDPYLEQAVQAGILTPEEAAAVRQAIEQGWIDLGPR
jgi:hypothetical protein